MLTHGTHTRDAHSCTKHRGFTLSHMISNIQMKSGWLRPARFLLQPQRQCVYVFTSEALNLSGRYRFSWLVSVLISAAPVRRRERHRLDVCCRTFAAATSALISNSVTRLSDTFEFTSSLKSLQQSLLFFFF